MLQHRSRHIFLASDNGDNMVVRSYLVQDDGTVNRQCWVSLMYRPICQRISREQYEREVQCLRECGHSEIGE